MRSEVLGVILTENLFLIDKNNLKPVKMVTENAAFARRVFSTIRRVYSVCPGVTFRRSRKLKKHISYTLSLAGIQGAQKILYDLGISGYAEEGFVPEETILKNICCRKSFLRAAFLAGGSISDPEKTYHLEIASHNYISTEVVIKLLADYGINAKRIKRKGSYVVYIKEGENIVDFLNIIGAHGALMELENVRILKEMRNSVNRIVNCETANLEKTVNASMRQIENIRLIQTNMGFDNLPENLAEIAEVRLEYSEASLKELGEMLNPPLGKSGVNHRLRKLDEIGNNLRERIEKQENLGK